MKSPLLPTFANTCVCAHVLCPGLILSTVLIVIFAEIIPQAFCSRNGLLFGAKTIWIIRVCMIVLAPVAWPLSFILDKVPTPCDQQILPRTDHHNCCVAVICKQVGTVTGFFVMGLSSVFTSSY